MTHTKIFLPSTFQSALSTFQESSSHKPPFSFNVLHHSVGGPIVLFDTDSTTLSVATTFSRKRIKVGDSCVSPSNSITDMHQFETSEGRSTRPLVMPLISYHELSVEMLELSQTSHTRVRKTFATAEVPLPTKIRQRLPVWGYTVLTTGTVKITLWYMSKRDTADRS